MLRHIRSPFVVVLVIATDAVVFSGLRIEAAAAPGRPRARRSAEQVDDRHKRIKKEQGEHERNQNSAEVHQHGACSHQRQDEETGRVDVLAHHDLFQPKLAKLRCELGLDRPAPVSPGQHTRRKHTLHGGQNGLSPTLLAMLGEWLATRLLASPYEQGGVRLSSLF